MADPYDDEDDKEELAAQREQDAYDREESSWAAGEGDYAGGASPQQAIPTAPVVAQQQPQEQQQVQYGDWNRPEQPAPQEQPVQQPAAPQQQQSVPQQPAQQPAPRAPAAPPRGRAGKWERDYGTPISDEVQYGSDEFVPKPDGGLGTVIAVDFMNFGHDILTMANAFGKNQLGFSTEKLEAMNAQFKEHIDKVRDGLDPARRAAQDVSVFDPSSFAGKDAYSVAEAYAVTLATGILGGLGPGLAAKVAVKTTARLTAGAAAKATAEAAGTAVGATAGNVAAIGTAGAVGAAQQTGARYEDYVTTIDKMTDEEKSKSEMYQGFRAQNMDDAQAVDAMKRQFPMLQQLGVNFVGATGLAAVTPGLGGVLPRLSSRTRNIAAGAAEAGGSVGAATGASAALQEQSKVEAGTQPAINWGQVAAEGAVGAGAGGLAGGAFGVFRGTRPGERPPPSPPAAGGTPDGAPLLALPPPAQLALPPPSGPILGPGGQGDFTMGRTARVQPSGVSPEHTAALQAAGIGRTAIDVEPGAQQFRPEPPQLMLPPAGSRGPGGPGDFTMPRGPEIAGAAPAALNVVPGAQQFRPEQSAIGPVSTAPITPSQPGAGGTPPVQRWVTPTGPQDFGVGQPPRAPPITEPGDFGVGRPARPPPTPPTPTGPQDFGVGQPPRPAPPPPPAPGPEGFGVGAPVARPVFRPSPRPGPPLLEASRERGPGFTVRESEPAPAQITASRERGAGFTTEPDHLDATRSVAKNESGEVVGKGATPEAARADAEARGSAPYEAEAPAPPAEKPATQKPAPTPRPSEGLNANQLDQRLADYGVSKAQRNRLVGREKKAAMLDKLEQEARGRGEESPPATPRGAEAREQPAATARPSDGMSHRDLGKALQDKGLSAREVNTTLLTKEARAAAYDKIVRDEAAALERTRAPAKEGAAEPSTIIRTRMEAGPDETKGHPKGEAEDRAWRKLEPERTADGKIKGAPEWVTKPRHLKQLRNLMKQLVKEGTKGRFWYEDSMKKIMAVTRDLREAERLTGLVAIFSPQRPVFTNMGLAIRAYDQWHRGERVRVGTESQDARAQRWLDTGQDWGGRKTNNFYLNLMHELITAHPEVLEPGNNRLNLPADVAAAIKGATVDLWVLRALGHRVDAAGGPGGTGATGSAATKYGFSDLEIKRLAGELNAGVPAGELRWLPHQVQAALWSAIKARFELPAVKEATWKESLKAKFATMEPDKKGVLRPTAPEKNGPARQGHMAIWRKHALAADPADVAGVIDTARGDFGAAMERMSQHVTVETIPSKDLGHPIYDASREAQEQFTREAHALLIDEDGNNLLAQKVGVNLGYDTYGAGSFEGKVSPNVVTTLIPEKPAGFFDRTKAKMYARAAQFIYRQDAVPFFRGDPSYDFEGDYSVRNAAGKVIRKFDEQADAQAYADREAGRTVAGGDLARGRYVEFARTFDEASQARLLAAIEQELGSDAGFTKVGDREAVIINFRGDDGLPFIDDVRFHDAVERIAARTDLGISTVSKFGSEGEYGPVHNWKSDRTGEVLADAAGGSPVFQAWLRDRHAAFGKLLDEWQDPEARLAASRGGMAEPGPGRGAGRLELPEARAPPDAQAVARAARERREAGADQRAAAVEVENTAFVGRRDAQLHAEDRDLIIQLRAGRELSRLETMRVFRDKELWRGETPEQYLDRTSRGLSREQRRSFITEANEMDARGEQWRSAPTEEELLRQTVDLNNYLIANDNAPPLRVGLERPSTEASRDQRNQPTAVDSPLSRIMQDDRVNAPVREAIDAGGSLHDGLRAIANDPFINKRLPHVAAYARQLLRLAPDTELRMGEGPGARGAFVSDEDFRTGQRWEHIEMREKSAEVLLHETTHRVTTRFIDSLEPGSREMQVLRTIRDELDRHATEGGFRDNEFVAYALSNPHELHAMLRTSPVLHDLMRGAMPGAEYRAKMASLGYPVGAAKSLWQSFVRFIRQALHLPQNVTSLMDHVMRPLDDISKAGSRFIDDPRSAYRRDSTGYHAGWDPTPLMGRTERELPSFSDVRNQIQDIKQGRAGNVLSGMGRAVRQGMPTHQIIGFNRHLFNRSSGAENHLDVINRAAEGVERVSREYGEAHQAEVDAALKKLGPEVNKVLTDSSRVDTNPAHPRDHPLNNRSKATPAEFDKLRDEYNALSPAQRQTVTDIFDMTRQQRVDRGDAAIRGLGKAYLERISDTQAETMVRQMRTPQGVDELLNNADTNPVARSFGPTAWAANREFVRAVAQEWKRGWINNYVPLHRNGDWIVNYTDPDTKQPGMLSRYTMREAETARLQLLEVKGANPSLVLSRERRTPSDIPRLSIVDRFTDKLQRKLGPENQAQIDAARDLLTKIMLDQSRFAGTMRQRLGVHGADPAKLPEAMAQNFMALKNAMGHLEYGPQYDAALAGMRRHVGEMGRSDGTVKVEGRAPTNADAIQAQRVLEEFQRRKPVSEDPNNLLLRGAQNATMLTYFKFLASPAQTMMNGIETYMQGIPRIGATFGLGRATTAMARASAEIMPRQFGRGVAGTAAAGRGRLDSGEWNSGQQIRDHLIAGSRRNDAAGMTALFQRLQDGNLIGYSSYRDLQNMARGGGGWIRHKADMAADFVSILHSKMEDANRAVTALAAYDVHLQRHGDRKAAIDYAEKILRSAAPNFNLSNKPRFATAQGGFGAWGIPIAQFRQHGMWAYSQFALDIRNAFKGADAATKSEARYALAFTIGMQTVLLGTLNWLADPLRYLWGAYDWFTGNKPQDHQHDFRRGAARIFGVTGGQFVSRGVLGAAGYGPYLNERVGMINPLLIPEFQGDWKNPKDVTYTVMTAIAGAPAVGAASEIISGLTNFLSGNIKQAVQDLVPKVIRDPIVAYRGETEGQITRRGVVQQTPEQVSTLDTVYRVFGFQSARQGERSEQTGAQRQYLDHVKTSREAATKEAARVLADGSASERRAANQMVREHNDRYPGSKIDFGDIARYRKEQVQRLKDPTLTALTVPKGLRPAVREQGAFANY